LLSVEKGVFPEFLIYKTSSDGILKVAGQIDLLIKDGWDIYIIDHKTNKEIKKKSYFDRIKKKSVSMKFPLANLDDCNY
jgi:ATP-dependent exoDNAse (exonuclease V) beta subunit